MNWIGGFQNLFQTLAVTSAIAGGAVIEGINTYLQYEPNNFLEEIKHPYANVAETISSDTKKALEAEGIVFEKHIPTESEKIGAAISAGIEHINEYNDILNKSIENQKSDETLNPANTPSGGGSPPEGNPSSPKYSYLVSTENFNNYVDKAKNGTLGRPSGLFVIPSDQMDKLLKETIGDVRLLEHQLGLYPGSLGSAPMRVDIINPPCEPTIPNGTEADPIYKLGNVQLGGNIYYRKGGLLFGGIEEYLLPQMSTNDMIKDRDWKADKIEVGKCQMSEAERLDYLNQSMDTRSQRYDYNLQRNLLDNQLEFEKACNGADQKFSNAEKAIKKAPLTDNEKSKLLSEASEERRKEKDIAADNKKEADLKAIDDWKVAKIQAEHDRYQGSVNGINTNDYIRDSLALDDNFNKKKDALTKECAKNLDEELKTPENQEKIAKLDEESKQLKNEINKNHDEIAKGIESKYEGKPEMDAEKQMELDVNERERENKLFQEEERYRQEYQGIASETVAMKNYNASINDLEKEKAKEQKGINSGYLKNKQNQDSSKLDEHNQNVSNSLHSSLNSIDVDADTYRENAKKEHAAALQQNQAEEANANQGLTQNKENNFALENGLNNTANTLNSGETPGQGQGSNKKLTEPHSLEKEATQPEKQALPPGRETQALPHAHETGPGIER